MTSRIGPGAVAGGLGLGVVTSHDALAGIAAEWAALDAALPVRTPFTSPAWNLLWWEHFRRDAAHVRDSMHVAVLRGADGGLVAVAPMMVTHRPGRLRPLLRELQFFGADPNLTELRGLACRPADLPASLDTLRRHVAGLAGTVDWIRWAGLPDAVPRAAWPTLLNPRQVVAYHLPLTPGHQQAMPRNLRDTLRKSRNALRRDGIAWTVERITEPDALSAALRHLFTLQARRAALTGTIRHPNPFAGARARGFMAAYVAAAARDGQACMFAIRIGGAQVALRMGFTYEHDLYLYYSAHDPAWRRYGVGTLVDAAAVEWAAGQGMTRVNLSTGSDLSKTRWRPAVTAVTGGVQVVSPVRGWLGATAIEALRRRRQAPA